MQAWAFSRITPFKAEHPEKADWIVHLPPILTVSYAVQSLKAEEPKEVRVGKFTFFYVVCLYIAY